MFNGLAVPVVCQCIAESESRNWKLTSLYRPSLNSNLIACFNPLKPLWMMSIRLPHDHRGEKTRTTRSCPFPSAVCPGTRPRPPPGCPPSSASHYSICSRSRCRRIRPRPHLHIQSHNCRSSAQSGERVHGRAVLLVSRVLHEIVVVRHFEALVRCTAASKERGNDRIEELDGRWLCRGVVDRLGLGR